MTDIDYEVAHGVCQIELAKAKAEIERLRAAQADLRNALAFVKAERDHWHGGQSQSAAATTVAKRRTL